MLLRSVIVFNLSLWISACLSKDLKREERIECFDDSDCTQQNTISSELVCCRNGICCSNENHYPWDTKCFSDNDCAGVKGYFVEDLSLPHCCNNEECCSDFHHDEENFDADPNNDDKEDDSLNMKTIFISSSVTILLILVIAVLVWTKTCSTKCKRRQNLDGLGTPTVRSDSPPTFEDVMQTSPNISPFLGSSLAATSGNTRQEQTQYEYTNHSISTVSQQQNDNEYSHPPPIYQDLFPEDKIDSHPPIYEELENTETHQRQDH